MPPNPLSPITAEEIDAAVNIYKGCPDSSDAAAFHIAHLVEPAKVAYLADVCLLELPYATSGRRVGKQAWRALCGSVDIIEFYYFTMY